MRTIRATVIIRDLEDTDERVRDENSAWAAVQECIEFPLSLASVTIDYDDSQEEES